MLPVLFTAAEFPFFSFGTSPGRGVGSPRSFAEGDGWRFPFLRPLGSQPGGRTVCGDGHHVACQVANKNDSSHGFCEDHAESLDFHPNPVVKTHSTLSMLEWWQRRPNGEAGLYYCPAITKPALFLWCSEAAWRVITRHSDPTNWGSISGRLVRSWISQPRPVEVK